MNPIKSMTWILQLLLSQVKVPDSFFIMILFCARSPDSFFIMILFWSTK